MQISLPASISLCSLHDGPTYNPLIVNLQWYLNCVRIISIKQPVQPNPVQPNSWMDGPKPNPSVWRSRCGCRGCLDIPKIRLGCPTPPKLWSSLWLVTEVRRLQTSSTLLSSLIRGLFLTATCIEIVWRKDGRERGMKGGKETGRGKRRGGERTPPVFETWLPPGVELWRHQIQYPEQHHLWISSCQDIRQGTQRGC